MVAALERKPAEELRALPPELIGELLSRAPDWARRLLEQSATPESFPAVAGQVHQYLSGQSDALDWLELLGNVRDRP